MPRAEPAASVRWISQLPGLGEWRRLIDYRMIQLPDYRTSNRSPRERAWTTARVLDYGADIVVVATGSTGPTTVGAVTTWIRFLGPTRGSTHVLTPEQVISGVKPIGETGDVFDSEGYFMGYSLAERLAGRPARDAGD